MSRFGFIGVNRLKVTLPVLGSTKNTRSDFGPRRWIVFAAFLTLSVAYAFGQGGFVAPLYVGNVAPVQDQYGRPMLGSPNSADAESRWRVEIRVAPYGGVRQPPGTNGVASALNPLVTTNSVCGMGMNATLPDSGFFCMAFPDRLPAGTQIFARAFNAPTLEEATFYADSKAVEVSAGGNTLVFEFDPAQALDSGDADGDGLNNSWESALGTDDRLTPDYDSDGMLDLHEMLAGTDARDANSRLAFRNIQRANDAASAGVEWGKPIRVHWQSIPGKTYRLEHLPMLGLIDPATGEPYSFELVEEVVAGEGEYEIERLVDVPVDACTGVFRVKLVTIGQ